MGRKDKSRTNLASAAVNELDGTSLAGSASDDAVTRVDVEGGSYFNGLTSAQIRTQTSIDMSSIMGFS